MAEDHYTNEGTGLVPDGADAIAEARKRHHLATADPEPERDGLMTGPAHEQKYGLERAEESEAHWRAAGVHPIENRALVEGEDGFENTPAALETADASGAQENTDAPKARRR